jgi:hypothetical protein
LPGQARGHPQDVGTGGRRVAVKAAGELQPVAASALGMRSPAAFAATLAEDADPIAVPA